MRLTTQRIFPDIQSEISELQLVEELTRLTSNPKPMRRWFKHVCPYCSGKLQVAWTINFEKLQTYSKFKVFLCGRCPYRYSEVYWGMVGELGLHRETKVVSS